MNELNQLKQYVALLEEDYNYLSEYLPIPLLILDANYIIQSLNSAALSFFSAFKSDNLVGTSILQVIPLPIQCVFKKNLHALSHKKNFTTQFICQNEQTMHVMIECSPINHGYYRIMIKNSDGFANNAIKETNDSLAKKLKQEVSISYKTNAVADITTAIVHEIKQPLTAITAYSNTCLHIMNNQTEQSTLQKTLFETLQKISSQAELAGDILHNMKNIMREGGIHFEDTDINQLIRDTIAILHYEVLDFNLIININLMANLPIIKTNKIHIMQVILNLLRNSIEALQSNSNNNPEITVETKLDQDIIYVHIIDNGPGIPREFRNIILHTYFTTKRKGTGIGLGICRAFIEEHGGTLSVQQLESQGAWFTFTLPLKTICTSTHE